VQAPGPSAVGPRKNFESGDEVRTRRGRADSVWVPPNAIVSSLPEGVHWGTAAENGGAKNILKKKSNGGGSVSQSGAPESQCARYAKC